MPILNTLISWINIKRLNQIEMFREYPFEVQNEMLFHLLKRARDTQWGLKFDYRSIDSIAEFQKRVPMNEYEGLRPWIERMMKGERDVLWPGEVKWFAKSSGTTSTKSKYIPVSKEALEECHFKAGKDVMTLYTHTYPDTKVLTGKSLTLGGSHQLNNLNASSYVGDLSAIYIQNVPFLAELWRVPSPEVALIPEFEEKLERIIECSVKENVTAIIGVPSWNLVLLKKILEYTGKSNILEIWPNLEVFVHGGISFEPYREQYKALVPTTQMHYWETYNASEGFFAIQDDPESEDMLLMLDYGIFYEFVPLEEVGKPFPKALMIEEVELGVNYALVISTNGGLWRYMIGDTIMFTSLKPYKIKITGRTKHFINAFGEEIIIDNAKKALKAACEATGATIVDYTAAPVFMGEKTKGRHQWMIEFEQAPRDLNLFRELLDKTLQEVNSDYEAKRHKSITLDPPEILEAASGLFYKWLKARGKIGGQNKVPRLANNREFMDPLIELNNSLK